LSTEGIVSTYAIEKLTTIDKVRGFLKEEVNRYNNHQVHSTTREIPTTRFDKAKKRGTVCFGLLPCPSPIPPLRTSSTYAKNGWSTAIERYLYSITIYQSHMCSCEKKLMFTWFLMWKGVH
jgi:hypothetical protein